jgi:hypothetical protein
MHCLVSFCALHRFCDGIAFIDRLENQRKAWENERLQLREPNLSRLRPEPIGCSSKGKTE